MPKRMVELSLELFIEAVSCPGVWLSQDGQVSLTVFALGSSYQTWRIPPIFPLKFQESFHFKKVYDKSCALNEVSCLLEDETVFCELIQWCIDCPNGKVLAQYLGQLGEMIFLPSMCSNDGIDLLMKTTKDYPGIIAPKIEIRSKVRIDQICNSDKINTDRSVKRTKSISPRRRKTAVCQSPDGSNAPYKMDMLNLNIPEFNSATTNSPETISRESSYVSDAKVQANVDVSNASVVAALKNGFEYYTQDCNKNPLKKIDSEISVNTCKRLIRSKPVGFEVRYPISLLDQNEFKLENVIESEKLGKCFVPCNCEICWRYHEMFH